MDENKVNGFRFLVSIITIFCCGEGREGEPNGELLGRELGCQTEELIGGSFTEMEKAMLDREEP